MASLRSKQEEEHDPAKLPVPSVETLLLPSLRSGKSSRRKGRRANRRNLRDSWLKWKGKEKWDFRINQEANGER